MSILFMVPLFFVAAFMDTIYNNRKRICKAIVNAYAMVYACILCLTGKA